MQVTSRAGAAGGSTRRTPLKLYKEVSMNQRNPWNLERLRDLIGQDESLIIPGSIKRGW